MHECAHISEYIEIELLDSLVQKCKWWACPAKMPPAWPVIMPGIIPGMAIGIPPGGLYIGCLRVYGSDDANLVANTLRCRCWHLITMQHSATQPKHTKQ